MPLPSGTLSFDEWEGAGFPKDTGCQVCNSLAPLEKAHLISRKELRSPEAANYKSKKLWEGENFAYLCRPCHEAFDKGLGVMYGPPKPEEVERLQKYAVEFMKLVKRRIELKGFPRAQRPLPFPKTKENECDHIWETLEDGVVICFECDKRRTDVLRESGGNQGTGGKRKAQKGGRLSGGDLEKGDQV